MKWSAPAGKASLAVVALAVYVTAVFGIELTLRSGRVASLWLANGVVLVALLRAERSAWPSLLLTGFLANLAADHTVGDGGWVAFFLTVCNSVEILTALWLLEGAREAGSQVLRLERLPVMVRCVVAGGLVAPAVSASLAVMILPGPTLPTFETWWFADALGNLLMVLLSTSVSAPDFVTIFRSGRGVEVFLSLAVAFVGTYVVFVDSQTALIFLLCPLFVAMAYRTGRPGAVLVGFTSTLGGVLALASGTVSQSRLPDLVWLLQLFESVNLFTTVPIAMLMDAVKASEQHFRSFFERHRTLMVMVRNRDYTIFDVNPAVTRFYGYEREAMLGMKLWSLAAVPPEVVRERVQRNAKENGGEFVFPHRLANGEIRQMLIQTSPVRIGGEDIHISTLHDITDRIAALRELTRQTTRYRSLMALSRDAIHLLDPAGNLVECNDAFVDLLGYTPEETRHLDVAQWDVGIPASDLLSTIDRLIRQGGVFETSYQNRDGRIFDVEVAAVGVQLEGERYLLASARDISDRKRAEIALRLSNERYDELVRRIPVGVYVVHVNPPTARIEYASPRFCELVNLDPGDLTAPSGVEAFLAAIVEEDRSGFRSLLWVPAHGDTLEWEGRFVVRGEVLWMRAVTQVTHVNTGGTRWDGVLLEISQETITATLTDLLAKLHEATSAQSVSDAARHTLERAVRLTASGSGFIRISGRSRLPHIFAGLTEEATEYSTQSHRSAPSYPADRVGALLAHCSSTPGAAYNSASVASGEDGGMPPYPGITHELLVPLVQDGVVQAVVALANKPTVYSARDEATVRSLLEMTWSLIARARAQENLHNTLQMLRAVVDSTFDAMFIKDLKGSYQLFNAAAGRFVGLSPDQVIGHTDVDVFSPGHAERVMQVDHQVLATEAPYTYEHVLHPQNGEPRTFLTTKGPLHGADGRLVGLFGVAHDVTERAEAEKRVSEAMHYVSTLVESMPVGVATFRTAGDVVSANSAMARLVGTSKEALLAQGYELFPSWKQDGTSALAVRALETGVEQRFEGSATNRQGHGHWLACRFVPFHHEGEPHLLVVAEDICERKRSEEELRVREEHLRLLAENAADTILRVDRTGVIEYANRGGGGIPREQIIGTNISDWSIPEQTQAVRNTLEAAFTTGLRQEIKIAGVTNGKGSRLYQARIAPVVIGGEIKTAVVSATDVTVIER